MFPCFGRTQAGTLKQLEPTITLYSKILNFHFSHYFKIIIKSLQILWISSSNVVLLSIVPKNHGWGGDISYAISVKVYSTSKVESYKVSAQTKHYGLCPQHKNQSVGNGIAYPCLRSAKTRGGINHFSVVQISDLAKTRGVLT